MTYDLRSRLAIFLAILSLILAGMSIGYYVGKADSTTRTVACERVIRGGNVYLENCEASR